MRICMRCGMEGNELWRGTVDEMQFFEGVWASEKNARCRIYDGMIKVVNVRHEEIVWKRKRNEVRMLGIVYARETCKDMDEWRNFCYGHSLDRNPWGRTGIRDIGR